MLVFYSSFLAQIFSEFSVPLVDSFRQVPLQDDYLLVQVADLIFDLGQQDFLYKKSAKPNSDLVRFLRARFESVSSSRASLLT